MWNFIDLTGKKFGQLIVVERDSSITPNGRNKIKWICKCDCGKIKSILGESLRNNKTISCGCYQKKIAPKIRKTHGESKTKFYRVWASMLQRCYNSNVSNFKNYGGRDISVCINWQIYENFKEDMYESYIQHNKQNNEDTTLERIDVNRDYDKSNCTWATKAQQGKNTTEHIKFIAKYIIKGPSYGYVEIGKIRSAFVKKYNLNSSCVTHCLQGKQSNNKGWKFQYILKEG